MPDSPSLAENLRHVRLRCRSEDQAAWQPRFARLARLHPGAWEVPLAHAAALLGLGEHEAAAALVAQAAGLQPPADVLAWWQGLLPAAREGRLEPQLRARLEAAPGDEEAALLLSDLLARQGCAREAQAVLAGAALASPAAGLCRALLLPVLRADMDHAGIASLLQAVPPAALTLQEFEMQVTALRTTGGHAAARQLALQRVDLWRQKAGFVALVGELDWQGEELARFAACLQEVGRTGAGTVRRQCALSLLALGLDGAAQDLLQAAPADGDVDAAPSEDALLRELLRRHGGPGRGGQVPAFHGTAIAEIAAPGSAKCLLVFAGLADQVQVPLALFQRLLEPLGVHAIYLRDLRRDLFLSGIEGLGDSVDAAAAALRARCAALGATEIYTLGNSSGGHAALRYGLALGARGAFGSGAPTNVSEAFMAVDGRAGAVIRRVGRQHPPGWLDLRPLIAAAKPPLRSFLHFGAGHAGDHRQAGHLAGLPGVALRPLAQCEVHTVIRPLAERGLLEPALRELMELPA